MPKGKPGNPELARARNIEGQRQTKEGQDNKAARTARSNKAAAETNAAVRNAKKGK